MSEEIIQKKYEKHGEVFGLYEFYNIGKTNISNLKKYKIVKNKDYGVYERKAPDAIICDRRNKKDIRVIAIIEHKQPNNFNTDEKKEEAFKQCNNYCEVLNAKIGIITDGQTTFWINPQVSIDNSENKYFDNKIERSFSYIYNGNGTLFQNNFDSSSTESIEKINMLLSTIDENNSKIKTTKFLSPSLLAKQVWQSVWLATGDDPKRCLMTFTELFIFKFLSDLKILELDDNGNEIDFDSVYKKGRNFCLKYYLSVVRPYVKKIFPPQSDGTTIINGLSLKKDQNQDSLFFDILTSFHEYGKLENIDPNFKSRLFEDFLKGTTGKKQLAQFFTPRNVIKAIVELANVRNLPENSKICDPACGVGGFIIEPILNRAINQKNDFNIEGSTISTKLLYSGYDYDDLSIILAKANLLIALTEELQSNPTLTKQFSSLLASIFSVLNNSIIGSLEKTNECKYDLIMSNPPYVSKGMKLYRDYIKDTGTLSNFYNTPSVGKEGLFIQKIIRELKPRGNAFIILPDGFFYRPADNKLKEYIINNCFIECIISLPEKTFYATTKKTYILGIRKKDSTDLIQEYPVFTAIAFNIGESLDVDRIPVQENDLTIITREYKYFHVDHTQYNSTINNIKIIDIQNFKNNLNWIIENYWEAEEKIQLGLLDSQKDISDEDLFDNIDFFNNSLDEFKQILEDELNIAYSSSQKYKTVFLNDTGLFKFITASLGYTRKEYSKYDTGNENDIPVYTAAKKPVAHVKPLSVKPIFASDNEKHISFATDGDGTAGTNIFLHSTSYYLNTSRASFKILNHKIKPEYVFYYMQDIKKKYGFDYKHKANQNNISEIEILIPVDENDEFDINKQNDFINHYLKMINIKEKIMAQFFEKINDFKNDIDNQLTHKVKEYFSID